MSIYFRISSLFIVFVLMILFGVAIGNDAYAQSCDDNNPCTTDRSTFVLGPGCPSFCTDTTCCPGGGFECVHTPVPDGRCIGIGCPSGATCSMGECRVSFNGETVACDEIPDCDDGLFCTTDIISNGECIHLDRNTDPRIGSCFRSVCDEETQTFDPFVRDPSACNDGNACNGVEICSDLGQCEDGPDLVCDDGTACNGTETCDVNLGCQPGTPVVCEDDGDLCNGTPSCQEPSGDCVNGDPVVVPDDGPECLIRSCDPATGVIFDTLDPSVCDDENACNGTETCDPVDGCQDGTPVEVPTSEVECVSFSCDPASGEILTTLDSTVCDDEDACTGIETCFPDGCVSSGPPALLDDGFSCTVESCDSDTGGTIHEPSDDLCEQGDECNGLRVCSPENAEPGSDGCVATDIPEIGAPCNDGEGVCSEEMMCVNATGTIKIVKMAVPNDGTDFLFSCVDENNEICSAIDLDGDGNPSFPLDDEPENTDDVPNMMTFADIPAGIYIFQESVSDQGWEISDIICLDQDGNEIVVEGLQPVLELDPFEEITCTFFNTLLCGNGELDEGEQCDDGNRSDDDFCSSTCFYFDSDADGVPDMDDLCPETEGGVVVGEDGCPIEEEMACDCDDPNAIIQGFSFRGSTYFYGTFADDIICGTSERDVIFSFAGDDCIDSGAGRDLIIAGFGNDIIFAGDDNDRVFAGPGDDEADGEDGNDFIHGGFGIDLCFGERLRRCE